MSAGPPPSSSGPERGSRGSYLHKLGLVFLLVASTVVSLAFVEISLRILGMYEDLAAGSLVSNQNTIWERPHHAVQWQNHPDLNKKVRVQFDGSGVRNHSQIETSDKTNMVAVFGDSYTENRRMDDRFTFTSVLDGLVRERHSIVNFGVDGYGLDQSYLRYKQFQDFDIEHVVYVLFSNDLRNLYENNIATLEDGTLHFKVSPPSIYRQTIGRLRVTYLLLGAFFQVKSFVMPSVGSGTYLRDTFWDRRQERELKRDRRRRTHDEFAGSMLREVLSDRQSRKTQRYAILFRAILEAWKRDAEANGRRFTIVVLPTKLTTDLAEKLRLADSFDTIFLNQLLPDYGSIKFANDAHWNEVGNVKAALALARHPTFNKYVRANADLVATEQRLLSEIHKAYKPHLKR